jgi:hypothetical protein
MTEHGDRRDVSDKAAKKWKTFRLSAFLLRIGQADDHINEQQTLTDGRIVVAGNRTIRRQTKAVTQKDYSTSGRVSVSSTHA